MLEQLWNGFLDLTSQFVIPDWGALDRAAPGRHRWSSVALGPDLDVPPPARRPRRRAAGKRRIAPATPAGIHMPGPSFAPILAAVGAFLLFLGLVFGGVDPGPRRDRAGPDPALLAGRGPARSTTTTSPRRRTVAAGASSTTGRRPASTCPGRRSARSSARSGTALLLLGLVFGGWLLASASSPWSLGLIGWLPDARREYVKTVEADTTGHLENIPAPRPPSRPLDVLAVLVVGAVVLQSGVLADRLGQRRDAGGSAARTPAGSAGAGRFRRPDRSGGRRRAAGRRRDGRGQEHRLRRRPRGRDRRTSRSRSRSTTRTPARRTTSSSRDSSGAVVFKGEIFTASTTRVYEVPALPAGDYTFIVLVHPNMTGTATLQ